MIVENLLLSGLVFINIIIIFKVQGWNNVFTYPHGACILNKIFALSIKYPKGQPAESNMQAFFNNHFILVSKSERGIPLQTWNFPSLTFLEQVGVLSAPFPIQETSPPTCAILSLVIRMREVVENYYRESVKSYYSWTVFIQHGILHFQMLYFCEVVKHLQLKKSFGAEMYFIATWQPLFALCQQQEF